MHDITFEYVRLWFKSFLLFFFAFFDLMSDLEMECDYCWHIIFAQRIGMTEYLELGPAKP